MPHTARMVCTEQHPCFLPTREWTRAAWVGSSGSTCRRSCSTPISVTCLDAWRACCMHAASATNSLIRTAAGLFTTSPSGNCTYTINSNSSFKIPDAPRWFHFAGRFMAKALFHGQTLRAHLAKPFYKVRPHPENVVDMRA